MPVIRLAAIVSIFCWAFLTSAHAQLNPTHYYNIKLGPLLFTLNAAVSTEFNDNINLANGVTAPLTPDIIISPRLVLSAESELDLFTEGQTNTLRNMLNLNMSLGFRKYLFHPALSQNLVDLNISPGSDLAVVIHAGNFKIRVHDSFALQHDPVADGSLSNVSEFRRFTNTFGIDTHWGVNTNTNVDFGYSHTDLIAMSLLSLSGTQSSLDTKSLNSSNDQLYASISTKPHSLVTVGFRTSVASTTHPSNPESDSTTYSYGPFTNVRITEVTSAEASYGVTQNVRGNFFKGSTVAGSGLDSTTEYIDFSLNNRMNTHYVQIFSVGRQTEINLLGDQTLVNYIRYSSTWRMNSKISVHFGLHREDTTNLSSATPAPRYTMYGADISTGYVLSRKLSTNLTYRYTQKSCQNVLLDYKQNSLTWDIMYRF